MAEKKIGAKIVIDGESEFRANLNSAKKALDNLDSELKLVTASFKNNANSLEALREKQQVYIKLQEEQKNKVSLLAEMQDKAVKKLQEEQNTLASLSQKREQLNRALEEAKSTYGENSEEVQNLTKELEDVNKEYETQEKVVQKTGDKVNTYQQQLNNAQTELTDLNDEIASNEKYLAEAENSADGCAKSIDEFGNEVSDATDKTSVFSDVLKAELLSSAIKEGIKLLAEGIKQIATASVETGSTFEASMSQVAATMGITTDEIANGSEAYNTLNKAAQDCGKSTMFSASQSAEALNYLALAGYDAEKAAATLPKVLNLAAAGGLDLAYASDLVTDSMAALGLETEQLDNYIDEMAKTSQKSNTSVSQLGEATLVCAGTVSLTGQSLETMNTALGVLANNGIKGAEGGTHLRNMLLSLSAPTDTASTAIENLGLQVNDSSGNMRDLNDIMTDMNRLMSGMTSAQKTQLIAKIFNKTDIASVNALLKSTNGEYEDLNAQIKNCSGAAQDMADTLNDNLKGKVTILQSALEGLGITAYDLFDDEMKGAVDSATAAVGRLQDSVDNGDLGVSLRNMSEALGDFATNAIGAAENALPVLIDGLTWILENGDFIISGIAGIAAAGLEMNVVAPAVTAVTAAWNAYKTANEGATVSQWLLNGAMNANPAGMIITAIVGLTAAVSAYAVMNKDSTKYLDDVTKSTKEQAKAAKELNDQYKQGISDRQQKRSDMEAETIVCQNLVTELKNLQEKTNLTAEEELRQKMIIEELNSVMPELNLQLDEQTGLLNTSTEELEKNVDAMMALAVAEAAREDLTQIAKDQYEAEKQLADLEEQLIQQKDAVAETQRRINEETEKYSGNIEMQMASTSGLCDLLNKQQSAQSELENQILATKDSITGFTNEYSKTMEYISNTEQIYKSQNAIDDLGEAAGNTGNEMAAMSQEAIEEFDKMQKELTETISGQMDLFSEFSAKCDLSTSQILKNMESQVTGISQWSENIQELADRGINKGLLQYLADMGPQGAGYVQAFTEMTDEELKKANELFEKSALLPDATANQIMDSYTTAGENAGEGYAQGIKSKEDEINDAAKDVSKNSVDTVKTEIKSHSPSQVTRDIGRDFDEGLRLGISENKDKILTLIKTITSDMLTKTKEGIPDEYKNIGNQIADGLRSGIESGRSGVIESMRSLCSQTIQAAKSALDIHSPSKKFAYLGEMSGEGYISGWEQTMQNIDSIIMDTMPDLPSGASNKIAGARALTELKLPDTIISKMEQQNTDILNACRKMQDMLTQYMPGLANMQMVTDTGTLIGELMPGLDAEFGNMEKEKERGMY